MEHPYEDRYKRVYAAGARFWEAPSPTEELVSFIGEWKPPKGKVIEFGCGEGRDSIFLVRSGYDVTGVDISPSAINRAREWANEEKLKIDFLPGDITALNSIPDNHFDLGVNIGCLHMFPDSEDRIKHLHEAWRVLKPKALYFFLNKGGGTREEVIDRFGPDWTPPKVGELRPRIIVVDGEEKEIMLPIIAGHSFKREELLREFSITGFQILDIQRKKTRPHGTCWQVIAVKHTY